MRCILQQRKAGDVLEEHDGKTSTRGEEEKQLNSLCLGQMRERNVGMLGRFHIYSSLLKE